MSPSPSAPARGFQFDRDTLTFANELVWKYSFHPTTGAMTVCRNDPPPTYSHRCFVVIKAARQFFYHARFQPDLPAVETEAYRRLIRQVIARNPRRASLEQELIRIPGYEGLRGFSQQQEALLKAECGGAWRSYFLRSHWRMVFPVWRSHQERIAERLRRRVLHGAVPLVHLFRFPCITINHGILVFGLTESTTSLEFEAYDPNITDHPVKLIYSRARREFSFPPTCYWAGGPLSVIEIFRGGLY